MPYSGQPNGTGYDFVASVRMWPVMAGGQLKRAAKFTRFIALHTRVNINQFAQVSVTYGLEYMQTVTH